MDKDQTQRYSRAELEVIRQTFTNRELLRSLQKVFLQTSVNALDQAILQVFKGNESLNRVLRKMFLPDIADDVPYSQVWDLTGAIDFKTKMFEDIVLHIRANSLVIKYFDQQLKVIESGEYQKKPKLIFTELSAISENKIDKDLFIEILARNNIMGTTLGRLQNLEALANSIDETPEERTTRMAKDSAK